LIYETISKGIWRGDLMRYGLAALAALAVGIPAVVLFAQAFSTTFPLGLLPAFGFKKRRD